jgi:penicillin-binding protein 1A
MRYLLERSINVGSIRVVLGTGIGTVAEHVRRFGFNERAAPRDVGIALGAGGVSAVDLARGYAAFANSGMRVEPFFIERIEDSAGTVVFEAQPKLACSQCDAVALDVEEAMDTGELASSATQLYPPRNRAERIISEQNAWLVADMMGGVIRRGTGRRARSLGRSDIAGKTGTTNEGRDTWFSGFNGDIVATSWVGFNDFRPLGRGEEGASTALPMWIAFMEEALANTPENPLPMPPGIVEVRINPKNGLSAAEGNPDVIFEKFELDNIPPREPSIHSNTTNLETNDSTLIGNGEPIF